MKSSYTKIKQTQSLQNLSNLYTARIEDFFLFNVLYSAEE